MIIRHYILYIQGNFLKHEINSFLFKYKPACSSQDKHSSLFLQVLQDCLQNSLCPSNVQKPSPQLSLQLFTNESHVQDFVCPHPVSSHPVQISSHLYYLYYIKKSNKYLLALRLYFIRKISLKLQLVYFGILKQKHKKEKVLLFFSKFKL